jgi:hypothetical protein
MSYIDSQGDANAFIYTASTGMVDLNSLIDPSSGWTLGTADDINASGEIIATGINQSGQEHALFLMPVATPEPSAVALLLVATAALTILGNSRRGRTEYSNTFRNHQQSSSED